MPGESAYTMDVNSIFIRFNPLPAIMPGESPIWSSASRQLRCFNPLPAIMPGESGDQLHKSPYTLTVSIHSRQLCRENRGRAAGRRLGRRSFNPLPAIMPGESCRNEHGMYAAGRFNPLPAIMPGESLSQCHTSQAIAFQSTPGNYAGRIPFTL